jgi:diguanylate cyclase (GGDEF)-like protein/PAS domain S-box-containing protein
MIRSSPPTTSSDSSPDPAAASVAGQSVQPFIGDLSVLFVDDDPVARKVFEKGIGPHLSDFHLAEDARQGLFSFARYAPDVVVTDIHMPGQSGLEMAQVIRGMRNDIPIIIATAFENTDYFRQAIEIGVYRYVAKPLDLLSLASCLAECGELVKRRRELLAQKHLSETVLHSLPYPAMLLRRADRRIMLANKAAMDLGFVAGAADSAGFAYAWGEQDLENLEFQASRQERGPAMFFGHAAFGRIWNVIVSVVGPGLVFVSAADVTRHNELERALRQAEATYRTIFENAVEGIFQTTPDGRLLKANEALARIFGYDSAPELIRAVGGDVGGIYIDPERRHELMRELRQRDVVTGFEFQIRKNGGAAAWISVSLRATRGEGGEVIRLEGLAEDVTEKKRHEQELKKRATHDELTGLPNRNFFHTQAGHMLAQAKRTGTPMALLYIDLDDFKQVNDNHGHHIGDGVLREVTQRLSGRLRSSDFLARIGGDEFFVLLWNLSNRETAMDFAGKLAEDVRRPCLVEGIDCKVGASVGISLYPDDGDVLDELVKKADAAMYLAKRLGKSACQISPEGGGFDCGK